MEYWLGQLDNEGASLLIDISFRRTIRMHFSFFNYLRNCSVHIPAGNPILYAPPLSTFSG
ncbi:MAG: hypothetical protein QOH19_673 [Actinomycetota bacterium]|nr:hypothetical protein [Actinomycetota bacterium]